MPIAENHITISHAVFDEGMRAAENIEYKKNMEKVAVSLILILTIAASWLLYTGGSLFFLLGEGIFLGALLFWLTIMLPNSRRKSRYKETQNLYILNSKNHVSVLLDKTGFVVGGFDTIKKLLSEKSLKSKK